MRGFLRGFLRSHNFTVTKFVTSRYKDRKDTKMDLEMGEKLLKMYFCSGDENWTEKIKKRNDTFILFQVVT